MCDFLWGLLAVGYWAGQIPQLAGPHVTDGGEAHETSFLDEGLLAVDWCLGKKKYNFLGCVGPDRLSRVQRMTPNSCVCGEHEFNSADYVYKEREQDRRTEGDRSLGGRAEGSM